MNALKLKSHHPAEDGRWVFNVEHEGHEVSTVWRERDYWPCLQACTLEQVEGWFNKTYGWAVMLLCYGKMEVRK